MDPASTSKFLPCIKHKPAMLLLQYTLTPVSKQMQQNAMPQDIIFVLFTCIVKAVLLYASQNTAKSDYDIYVIYNQTKIWLHFISIVHYRLYTN